MQAWTEVLGDRTIGGEKSLGMPGRFEVLHALLPLAGGLVGVFSPIIEVPVLSMFHPQVTSHASPRHSF
jgi:hypothetical protein